MVGELIALDLAKEAEVTVVDPDEEALARVSGRPGLRTVRGSALDRELVSRVCSGAEVVCGALPGRLGFGLLEMLIDLGLNAADISFMPQNFLDLDRAAREKGVTVVPDFGVAPGMCHLLVGRAAHLLDEVEEGRILVGGIPAAPKPPWNFKLVFSPEDTLDEYNRPARFVEDGGIKEAPALSGLELVEFPGIGTLEAFLTDGLRSLTKTVKARRLSEKTMRWPGHAAMMEALRSAGMFDPRPRRLAGVEAVPLKITSELLFEEWRMRPEEGDRDLTVMRVAVSGRKGEDRVTLTWDLVDRFDEEERRSSMSRVTAFPCAIMARAIASGLVQRKGVLAPESLAGDDRLFGLLMAEQAQRGVVYHQKTEVEKGRWGL